MSLNKLLTGWFAYILWAYILPKTFPTVCPFRLITKLECPLCGTTTAIHNYLHGTSKLNKTKITGVLVLITGLGLIVGKISGIEPASKDIFEQYPRQVIEKIIRRHRIR